MFERTEDNRQKYQGQKYAEPIPWIETALISVFYFSVLDISVCCPLFTAIRFRTSGATVRAAAASVPTDCQILASLYRARPTADGTVPAVAASPVRPRL